MYTDFSPLTERMKKIIRKIRKSTLQREYFQKLQEEMALPQHVLLKATEVRWNSLYQMCDRFYQNKRAISLFIENSAGGIQHFSDVDWELIGALVEQLKPIFFITKELEKRRSTISSIVPIYRSLLNKLRKFNTAISNRVADGLESRMTGWEMKRKLIVPVILDPNFKMDFFDREMREMYKMWLVDELAQNVEVRQNPNIEPEIEADVACTSERSTPISILEEFVQENSFGEIETLFIHGHK